MAKRSKRSKRNRKRKTLLTAKHTPSKRSVRPIGQIIELGPHNELEEDKLKKYDLASSRFYAKHFSGIDATPQLIRSAVNQTLRQLSLVRSDFRHAIQTQHLIEAQQRLARIADKAKELLQQGSVQSEATPKSSSEPESAQLIGYGGFPANSCQMCGRYLTHVCYSTIYNANRVPRTDKICTKCFLTLPRSEKELHYMYDYRRRAEPRGVGWNPEGEWGK